MKIQFEPYVFEPYVLEPFDDWYRVQAPLDPDLLKELHMDYRMDLQELYERRAMSLRDVQYDFQKELADRQRKFSMDVERLHKDAGKRRQGNG